MVEPPDRTVGERRCHGKRGPDLATSGKVDADVNIDNLLGPATEVARPGLGGMYALTRCNRRSGALRPCRGVGLRQLEVADGGADDAVGRATRRVTTASSADLTKNVPRPGVKGVTDTTIRVAVITAKTNPIGGRYHEFIDGIHAYFKVINDAGGIYGRKLVVVSDRDDVVGTQNVQQTTASLADDNAFATFEATQQLTAADMLAKAHMPTFIWNIDPESASTPTSDHSNIFGTNASICFSCPGPLNAWLADKNGFTKVGVLGYGVSAESKLCASGHARRVQAVHERQGAGRLLRRHAAVRGRRDCRRAEHEGQGCPVRHHVHGHQ